VVLALALFCGLLPTSTAFLRSGTGMGRRMMMTPSRVRMMASSPRLTKPAEQLLNEVDVFIFDCDGIVGRLCVQYESIWTHPTIHSYACLPIHTFPARTIKIITLVPATPPTVSP
jgi:hypothetical protein